MILTRNSSQIESYLEAAREGKGFSALASITGITAFGTAAATGGPLLWNNTGPAAGANTPRVLAVLLGLSFGWTTAPAASGVIGITWGSGQTSAPTSTTAITAVANLRPDGPAPLCNTYVSGTVANPGTTMHLTHEVSTAAGNPSQPIFVPLDGLIVVPPTCWASVAAAATIATMVGKISLVWAEIPY